MREKKRRKSSAWFTSECEREKKLFI